MQTGIAHEPSKKMLLGASPSKELVDQYSNELHVTAETPPTFLIHAMDDDGVIPENSMVMHGALRKSGVAVEMHLFPTGGHGFALARDKGTLSIWTELLTNWMEGLLEVKSKTE